MTFDGGRSARIVSMPPSTRKGPRRDVACVAWRGTLDTYYCPTSPQDFYGTTSPHTLLSCFAVLLSNASNKAWWGAHPQTNGYSIHRTAICFVTWCSLHKKSLCGVCVCNVLEIG